MRHQARLPRTAVRTLYAGMVGLLSLIAAAAGVTAQAEATTGVIRGVVRDPTGSGVGGAAVIIHHQETGLTRTLETTSTGTFVGTLLPVGTYDVTARAIGQFGDVEQSDIRLRVGETVQLILEFRPVAVEEITVAGERAPLVDETDVTSSQRLSTEVVDNLPNNGRNYLDYTLLTPGVSISQGPDGAELNISGQRGIFNNIIVDGADFNNPFFGEQRGGQRPAFTFNQDAVEELVVVNQGASAEFGRSAGGFVNAITKSGTNEFEGTAHYFGQWDGISSGFPEFRNVSKPDFYRHQFGLTLGGPIVRDRAFFFVSYDQQEASETKQFQRNVVSPAELDKLETFLQSQWPGLFDNEFGPVDRTDDNKALIAKLDVNLSDRHRASLKYNYTWSQQVNGTFDVDSWGLSANGIEKDFSHAVNGSLNSQLSNVLSNEFRFQYAREDRPRAYEGPLIPGATPPAPPQFGAIGGRPFPDIGMDFADGFRIGLPFFLPIEPGFDTRLQLVDNVTYLAGDHLFKAGVEFNRTQVKQQFIGFANGRYLFDSVDSFINFVQNGDDSGVVLYLQSVAVPPTPQDQLGLQSFDVHELGLFIQDTWNPLENLTLNLGVRWEGTWHPSVFIEPDETFFAPFLDDPNFPSDGRIPDDLNNFQPRFGLAWDVDNDGRTVVRANAGSYFSRIPMLVFAQHRTTNGAFQAIAAGSGANYDDFGVIPPFGELFVPTPDEQVFFPDISVASKDLQLPRTWSFSGEVQRLLTDELAVSLSYQHARTDNLFRFFNGNDAALGSPYGAGSLPGGNGIGALFVTESTARSRYNAFTLGLRGRNAFEDLLTFEANYTLAWDKSDDDNERDPFTFRYASAANLAPEYNWSDRDRRHRVNGYFLFRLPADIYFNNIVRYATASPVSESCGPTTANPFAPPAGGRAAAPADRVCADGSILKRNTLRRENDFFMWDIRISKGFAFGNGQTIEPILEVFNVTNADNFLDTAQGSLLFNFDGTIRSGLGETRRAQLGVRFSF